MVSAPVEVQVSVDDAPEAIVVGAAEKVTVGRGMMLTVAVAVDDPPGPVAVSV
jgi:hypothetical protein